MPFGAIFGVSYLNRDINATGTIATATSTTPYKQTTTANETKQYYGSYSIKGFQVDVEYLRNLRDVKLFRTAVPAKSIVDARSWYVSGSYHVTKHLDMGAYHSVHLVDYRKPNTPGSARDRHCDHGTRKSEPFLVRQD